MRVISMMKLALIDKHEKMVIDYWNKWMLMNFDGITPMNKTSKMQLNRIFNQIDKRMWISGKGPIP